MNELYIQDSGIQRREVGKKTKTNKQKEEEEV